MLIPTSGAVTAKPEPLVLEVAHSDQEVDLDGWAAEQNEIARHNASVYLADLIDYATVLGCDWRTPGSLEKLREKRQEFVRKMRRVSKVTDEELIQAYNRVTRAFPGLKQYEYYRRIGKQVGLHASRVQFRLLRAWRHGRKVAEE
jgi:hypothetical protein